MSVSPSPLQRSPSAAEPHIVGRKRARKPNKAAAPIQSPPVARQVRPAVPWLGRYMHGNYMRACLRSNDAICLLMSGLSFASLLMLNIVPCCPLTLSQMVCLSSQTGFIGVTLHALNARLAAGAAGAAVWPGEACSAQATGAHTPEAAQAGVAPGAGCLQMLIGQSPACTSQYPLQPGATRSS